MSNAFIKLEEQLSAAQAEVARLHESASALREMDNQCDAYATQSVVLTRERDEARASLHAAGVEIAALRRVLAEANGAACAELCERLVKPDRVFHVKECREAQAALSVPSAAEPLLADILAAAEAMSATLPLASGWCDDHPNSEKACRSVVHKGFEARDGLRRWVP